MRPDIPLAALLSLVLGAPVATLALEPREVFRQADASVVVLRVSRPDMEGIGSGVLVTPWDVITSCHVVAKARTILVVQGNVQRNAKLRFDDAARDLCQIRIDDPFPNGKPVAGVVLSRDLEVGQTVYAIGAPRGLEHTLSRGLISALREMKGEDAKLIQTDAAISPGSSGGGLFDENAKLVGIVAAGLKESEGLNFAVPADWIAEVATRNRDRLLDFDKTAAAIASTAPGNPAASGASATNARERWWPNIGDRWKYRLLLGTRAMGTVVVEIMEASGNRVQERITIEGQAGFVKERWIVLGFDTRQFQPTAGLSGGYQLAELAPYAAPDTEFKQGQKWANVPGVIMIPHTANTPALHDVRIVGKERVRVPAGEYDTWKVETFTSFDIYSGSRGRFRCTFWYSPNAKRTVKMQLKLDSDISTFQSTETYELAAIDLRQ